MKTKLLKTRIIIFAFTIILLASICSCAKKDNTYNDTKNYNSDAFALPEIDLSGSAGPASHSGIECNESKLKNNSAKNGTVYVYGNPERRIDKIVELMGFDIGDYETAFDGKKRLYTKDTMKMYIDEYGVFDLTDTSASWKGGNCSLSDKEYAEKAKQYLVEHDLWPVGQIGDARTTETSTTSSKGTIILSKGVTFYPKSINGFKVGGTRRITVMFNDEGQVSDVYYNWRIYSSRRAADVLSISGAIEKIKAGKATFDIGDDDFYYSDNITINSVEVIYWDETTNPDNLTVQPVYVFTGKATKASGKSTDIYFTVQANVTDTVSDIPASTSTTDITK